MGGIYYVYQIIFTDESFSADSFIQELLFFRQFDGKAFWYIPVIVGIYLFIPFVSCALKMPSDRKTLLIPVTAAFLFLFVPPVINMFRNLSGLEGIGTRIDFSYIGGTYGFLIILGYMIKKGMFRKACRKMLTVIAVISFVIIVILRNRLCEIGHPVDVWYNSALLLIVTLSVFLCVLPVQQIRCRRMFEWISRNSFGMYLIHELFCKIFSNLIVVGHLWMKEVILFALVCAATAAAVWLLGLNKKVARVFLYAR